jgi:hypothetical protein
MELPVAAAAAAARPIQMKSALRKGRFSGLDSHPENSDCKSIQPLSDHDDRNDTNCLGDDPSSSPCSTTQRSKKKVVVPTALSSKGRSQNKQTIPTRGCGQSGSIQSRTSTTSLLLNRWNQSYWLHVYPASLVIFDSEVKMKQWKVYYEEDTFNGISLNDKSSNRHARKKLIQMKIDFDTQGQLQSVINRYELQQQTSQHSSFSDGQSSGMVSAVTASAPSCVITTIAKYAMEEVRSKYYSRKGPLMHTCKISYLSNTGRSILVAFGSTEADELKKIRSVIRYCINLVNKASKVHRGMRSKSTLLDKNSTALSAVMGMSAVSGTKYGEATMDGPTALRWGKRKRRMSSM